MAMASCSIVFFPLWPGSCYAPGPASRNPDDIEHAAVSVINPKQVLVGFEDLFGGGDFDYNDVLLRVKR
jgi:Domain of unknown function (DUF4114)